MSHPKMTGSVWHGNRESLRVVLYRFVRPGSGILDVTRRARTPRSHFWTYLGLVPAIFSTSSGTGSPAVIGWACDGSRPGIQKRAGQGGSERAFAQRCDPGLSFNHIVRLDDSGGDQTGRGRAGTRAYTAGVVGGTGTRSSPESVRKCYFARFITFDHFNAAFWWVLSLFSRLLRIPDTPRRVKNGAVLPLLLS